MFSQFCSIRRLVWIAAILTMLVPSLLVPAAGVSAAGGPTHWARVDTSIFDDDLVKVNNVVLKKDTGVVVTGYLRDATGAPVWATIVSAANPAVDGYYIPFALLTKVEPTRVALESQFGLIKTKVVNGSGATPSNNGITARDLSWMRRNIGNAELFPTLASGAYITSSSARLYRGRTVNFAFQDSTGSPLSVPISTTLSVDLSTASEGLVLVSAPAMYAGGYIEIGRLLDAESASARKARLDKALDKPLSSLNWEELIYVMKAEASDVK